MTVRQILRFVLGTVIAVALLFSILPHFGIPVSRMLPPAAVYAHAQGTAVGMVEGKKKENVSTLVDPAAEKVPHVHYSFQAPDPKDPAQTKTYTGSVAADWHTFYVAHHGTCQVKYEKTNPEINGITELNLGQSDTAPNKMLGAWMIWPVVALVLGYLMSLVLAQFMKGEDI